MNNQQYTWEEINSSLVQLQDQYEDLKNRGTINLEDGQENPFEHSGGSDMAGCIKEMEAKREFLRSSLHVQATA